MKWIAAFFTLVMVAAAGLAAVELRAALSEPTPRADPDQVARAVVEVAQDTPARDEVMQACTVRRAVASATTRTTAAAA